MKKYKLLTILSLIALLLQACGAGEKIFSSQKKKSTDEFLVEKKSPLVMPPEFNKLPEPDSENSQKKNNSVKKLILNSENSTLESTTQKKVNKDFESSILEKIKKN